MPPRSHRISASYRESIHQQHPWTRPSFVCQLALSPAYNRPVIRIVTVKVICTPLAIKCERTTNILASWSPSSALKVMVYLRVMLWIWQLESSTTANLLVLCKSRESIAACILSLSTLSSDNQYPHFVLETTMMKIRSFRSSTIHRGAITSVVVTLS